MRTAAEVDAADPINRERDDVFDVAVHQPFEAVAHADDVHALEGGADGCGADHAVDAWCGSTADENGEFLVTFHTRPPRAAEPRSRHHRRSCLLIRESRGRLEIRSGCEPDWAFTSVNASSTVSGAARCYHRAGSEAGRGASVTGRPAAVAECSWAD